MDEKTYDPSTEEILKYLREKASIGDREFINEIYQKFFKSDGLSSEDFCTSVLKLKNGGNNFIDSLSCVLKSEETEKMSSHFDLSLSQSLSMLFLFNSIENLMEGESYYSFDEWVVSPKDRILGKSERNELLTKTNIINIELFNNLIKELYEIYEKKDVSYYENFEEWLTSSQDTTFEKKKRDKLLENTSITDIKKFNKLIKDLSKLHGKEYGSTDKARSFFIKYLKNTQKEMLIISVFEKNRTIDKFVYMCFEPKDHLSEDSNTKLGDYNECPDYKKCKHYDSCKLKSDNIDEVMKLFASFLYRYYRSAFAHFGHETLFATEEIKFIIDNYKNKEIKIVLSYSDLKKVIISGIKNYYFQNCEV